MNITQTLGLVAFCLLCSCAPNGDHGAETGTAPLSAEVPVVAQMRAYPGPDWDGQFFPVSDETAYLVGYYDREGRTLRWTASFLADLEQAAVDNGLSDPHLGVAGLEQDGEMLSDTWFSGGLLSQGEYFVEPVPPGGQFRACLQDESGAVSLAVNLFRVATWEDDFLTPTQANDLVVRVANRTLAGDYRCGSHECWWDPPPNPRDDPDCDCDDD